MQIGRFIITWSGSYGRPFFWHGGRDLKFWKIGRLWIHCQCKGGVFDGLRYNGGEWR